MGDKGWKIPPGPAACTVSPLRLPWPGEALLLWACPLTSGSRPLSRRRGLAWPHIHKTVTACRVWPGALLPPSLGLKPLGDSARTRRAQRPPGCPSSPARPLPPAAGVCGTGWASSHLVQTSEMPSPGAPLLPPTPTPWPCDASHWASHLHLGQAVPALCARPTYSARPMSAHCLLGCLHPHRASL